MNRNKHRTIDLKTSFLRLLLPALIAYSCIVSAFFIWHDFRANEASREQSQKLVFDTFYSSIRQPLLQGSTIEAEIRAQELLKNPQVLCVELQSHGSPVTECKRDLSKFAAHTVADTFRYGADSRDSFAELKVTFDNSDLRQESWQKLGKFAGAFAFLGFLLFMMLSFGFGRIRSELSQVLRQAQGVGEASHENGFRITEFRALSANLLAHMRLAAESAESKAALEISQQVAHDIRSPLAALKAVLKSAEKFDSVSSDTLKFAVQRIVDVSNDLARKHDTDRDGTIDQQNMPAVINLDLSEIIAEKRVQYPKSFVTFVEETEFAPAMVSKVSGSDFRRIVSNLLDNAVQSLAGPGRIEIRAIKLTGGFCEIRITDDGIGIPAEILPRLFSRGATFGKPGGKGIGLFWSKEVLSRVGGQIRIESVKNNGTTVIMTVPVEGVDSWCVPNLTLVRGMKLAVIDDDRCVYQAWRHRIGQESVACSLQYDDGQGDISSLVRQSDLCLFDFDLGKGKPNGLEIIDKLGCAEKSLLVTSQYDVESVQHLANALGVKILPKSLIDSIEIQCTPASVLVDFVFGGKEVTIL